MPDRSPTAQNIGIRGMWVQAMNGGVITNVTGFRLGTQALLSLDSTASHAWQAAVRDCNGLWSELGPVQNVAFADNGAGTAECSIGSGATSGKRMGRKRMGRLPVSPADFQRTPRRKTDLQFLL